MLTPKATATPADARLAAWITREEGTRLKPYRDTEGLLTIGIGRCLDTTGINADEAQYLLRTDLQRASQAVELLGRWTAQLDDVRWAALVAMAFQMGAAGLRKFKATLAAMEAGDYAQAARQMLRSLWARQTPARAQRTARMVETGQWPEGV